MLYLGADHNGFGLKEKVKLYLQKKRVAFVDCGAFVYKKSDDYPDFAQKVGKRIKKGDLGILFCGSGHGMVIAANKIRGIRAIMPLNETSARDGRHDDHANILVLAAWECSFNAAKRIIAVFMRTKPGKAARYLRRLKKVRKLER